MAKKDPAAVALGRKGGKARLTKMTPEQRSSVARQAVRARWDGGGAAKPAPPSGAGRIEDWRLEKPDFRVVEVDKDGDVHYEVRGNLDLPVPPIRDSKYLKPAQAIEIYKYMLLNRGMEFTLEKLYKQSKVVGGVYFGTGQEGCSVASAYALGKDDWIAPMIRNQGAFLVRGYHTRDVMMQYMAKAEGPTKGKDAGSHFGSIDKKVSAPISMLGDSIPVMAGIALGARLQGRNIACLTWIGDGGQSTGVTYEGFNFAAVQKLGVVLIVESNHWAYSTPTEEQVGVKDLAQRAIGYGVPGVIVDGTDPCQVYDATYEAVERAYRGEGATLIEAKMMRMKGHAIHDAAQYVPAAMREFWQKRDCIARFEKYLVDGKKWLTREQNERMKAEVERQLDDDRMAAEASPMPEPEWAAKGVYCAGADCHPIPLMYGEVQARGHKDVKLEQVEAAVHLK
ncbi:MAG TPA: thiamine pyrophosphate-dependent dehydrogenase E1 component subunit alpha [Terriglobales bacterium]|nr:thiamine pyrophosphate-dependent dehydrogenase E1 component subunit alpha [Terriglobales bacterium]